MGSYSVFRQKNKKISVLYTFRPGILLVLFCFIIIAGPAATDIVNAQDGKTVNTWNRTGLTALYNGDYEKAIENFQKADQTGSLNLTMLINMSLAYWLGGNQDKAFGTMDRVLEKKSDPIAFYHLAYFYHLTGDKGQAFEYFKKAQKLAPNILQRYDPSILKPSPTRIFYQGELDTAKTYIGSGTKAPAVIVDENRVPSIEIIDLSLDPDPVPVNQAFDFQVKFKVDIPDSADNKISTILHFKINRDNKTLFNSKPYPIKADNGKIKTFRMHIDPVSAKSVYTIKAFVKCKDLLAEKSMELIIQ